MVQKAFQLQGRYDVVKLAPLVDRFEELAYLALLDLWQPVHVLRLEGGPPLAISQRAQVVVDLRPGVAVQDLVPCRLRLPVA